MRTCCTAARLAWSLSSCGGGSVASNSVLTAVNASSACMSWVNGWEQRLIRCRHSSCCNRHPGRSTKDAAAGIPPAFHEQSASCGLPWLSRPPVQPCGMSHVWSHRRPGNEKLLAPPWGPWFRRPQASSACSDHKALAPPPRLAAHHGQHNTDNKSSHGTVRTHPTLTPTPSRRSLRKLTLSNLAMGVLGGIGRPDTKSTAACPSCMRTIHEKAYCLKLSFASFCWRRGTASAP